jgi:hypothetical protein
MAVTKPDQQRRPLLACSPAQWKPSPYEQMKGSAGTVSAYIHVPRRASPKAAGKLHPTVFTNALGACLPSQTRLIWGPTLTWARHICETLTGSSRDSTNQRHSLVGTVFKFVYMQKIEMRPSQALAVHSIAWVTSTEIMRCNATSSVSPPRPRPQKALNFC